MGYSERCCQLCGISFRVGRIRTSDEPVEAAWDYNGNGVVETDICGCEAEGCENIDRTLPEYTYHDGSVREPEEVSEHIAGPACTSTSGYSGHRISLEEMGECTQVQCLMSKDEQWTPEPSDEDFERASRYSWLTGVSKGPPDEFDVHWLVPTRHGISDTNINNCGDPDPEWGTPMHPVCFQMFKTMSLERFGKVAIDELRLMWLERADYRGRFFKFRGSNELDVSLVSDQFYECVPGTEYLVAHPLRVPELDTLISSCLADRSGASDVVFEANGNNEINDDPFAALSPELKAMIIYRLDRRDVANLRLTSRSFQQIPQSYFRALVVSEMPWIWWDIKNLPAKQVDWYQLWCNLFAADGGSQVDELERDMQRSLNHHHHDGVLAGLSEEDREEIGEKQRNEHGVYVYTDEQRAKLKAIVRERARVGKTQPKSTEIKGLRNRRRIYQDIAEILDLIEDLDNQRMFMEWSVSTRMP